jgi:tetratricopeptide (TPR) repeat protein
LIYFYQKDFRSALKRWSKLEEELPGNPHLLSAMGSALLYLQQYEAALGELLVLSEVYNKLVADLGEIKPWSAYHQRILRETAAVYNNLGVAYQKLSEKTQNPEYQRESLVALYRAGELADTIGGGRGEIQYNINYILHPEVIRGNMAIHDSLSENYRFVYQ